MDVAALPRLQFQGFTLDRMRCCLSAGEREIGLRPKSFGLLCLLVERHGRLVAKDEIFQAVWPNVTVTDDSLFQCVRDIRQALNDGDQRLVKTVPGRGYIFTAPVVKIQGTAAEAPPAKAATVDVSAPQRLHWFGARWSLGAVGLLTLLGAGLIAINGGVWSRPPPAAMALPDRPSIAVLPFTNLSGHADQLYLSDGIAQDISGSLSKFNDLFVIAHHSAARYRTRDATSEQIGRELGVRYLLKGSVRKDADRVRITADLI